MTIKSPDHAHIPGLRLLWQQAFGDTDAFLDSFFQTAFSCDRCRCVFVDDKPVSALYWFDCSYQGRKLAYLYALATEQTLRKQGFGRALMEDTHRHLQALGYDGAVLVPGEKWLFGLYEKLGYAICCAVREFHCEKTTAPLALQELSCDEYAALRKVYLPKGGVVQEGETLAFLSRFSRFYATRNAVFAASVQDGVAVVHELLGEPGEAEGIVAALGANEGRFRTPGQEKAFAMFLPLAENCPVPQYLGLALD